MVNRLDAPRERTEREKMIDVENARTHSAFMAGGDAFAKVFRVGDGSIARTKQLGSLTKNEIMWLTSAAISGWIMERSRQRAEERWPQEKMEAALMDFRGEGYPLAEPKEAGHAIWALPYMAQLLEDLGCGDQPVNEWGKEQIIAFIVGAHFVMTENETAMAERPGPLTDEELAAIVGPLSAG